MMDDSSSSISSGELLPIEADNTDTFNYDDPHSYSILMKAVLANDIEKVKTVMQLGTNLRAVDNHGHSALHIAVKKSSEDDVEILEYMLSANSFDINARNYFGETAVLLSVKLAKYKAARMLIKAGADITIPSNDGCIPLHLSIKHSPELLEELILAGADIDAIDYNGDTALHDAVYYDKLESLCLLLYYGADTSIRNPSGTTPFMHCLILNRPKLADELFDYELDFNLSTADGMSTLGLAITDGYPRIIEMIEKGGADVNFEMSNYCLFQLDENMNIDIFKYIWDRFDYEKSWKDSVDNIISHTLKEDLPVLEKQKRIEVILKSENNDQLFHLTEYSERQPMISNILEIWNVTSEQFEEYCSILLMNNMKLYKDDMEEIFKKFGDTKYFRTLLFMDQRNWYDHNTRTWFPRMIFQPQLTDLFDDLVFRNDLFSCVFAMDFEMIFDFWVDPQVTLFLLRKFSDEEDLYSRKFLKYIRALPSVPALQDLAIRSSRKYLCERYEIKSCMEFYSTLKFLDISDNLKKLISYQVPIYRKYLTPKLVKFRDKMKKIRGRYVRVIV